MEDAQLIDDFMKYIEKNRFYQKHKDSEFLPILSFCEAQGLVKYDGNKLVLDKAGYDVLRIGGYERWKSSHDVEKEIEGVAKTNQANQSIIPDFFKKNWWVALIITALITWLIKHLLP